LNGLPMAQIHVGTYLDHSVDKIEAVGEKQESRKCDRVEENISRGKNSGTISIDLKYDTIETLESYGLLLPSNLVEEDREKTLKKVNEKDATQRKGKLQGKKTTCLLDLKDLDIIHTLLSSRPSSSIASFPISRRSDSEDFDHLPYSFKEDREEYEDMIRLKNTIVKLIDTAVKSVLKEDENQYLQTQRTEGLYDDDYEEGDDDDESLLSSTKKIPHLVLMTYSATSNILASALSEWKNQAITATKATAATTSSQLSLSAINSLSSQKALGKKRKYPKSRQEGHQSFDKEEIEKLLHRALTVVTIGSLTRDFIDGPAYIHVSMDDDVLSTNKVGTRQNRSKMMKHGGGGGGGNAVYFHGISPYNYNGNRGVIENQQNCLTKHRMKEEGIYTNDAHNLDSCLIQYLSLIRRINGISSFRKLYTLGSIWDDELFPNDINPSLFSVNYESIKIGQLVMPPDLDYELLPSMIRATGGHRFLFQNDNKHSSSSVGVESTEIEDDASAATRWIEGGDSKKGDDNVMVLDDYTSFLPSLEDAESNINNQFGYSVYDEIVEACYDDD